MSIKELHPINIECTNCHNVKRIDVETDIGVQLRNSDLQSVLIHFDIPFNCECGWADSLRVVNIDEDTVEVIAKQWSDTYLSVQETRITINKSDLLEGMEYLANYLGRYLFRIR